MDSFKHPRAFDPLDLEIIDRVYEAAWAQVEARRPFCNPDSDGEQREALRRHVMACAAGGKIEFDALYERVVAHMPEPWVTFMAKPVD
jgi:hypothetical protein